VTDGTSCADSDVCNGDETCVAGLCTSGAPLACTDGPACSTGTCDRTNGCSYGPLEGFPGLLCLCGQGLAPASCGTTTLRPSIVRRYAHACAVVSKAAALQNPRRARRLANAAVQAFGSAAKTVLHLTKKARVPSDCGQALMGVLDDTQDRARRVRDTL
jgi:hypothetical protein